MGTVVEITAKASSTRQISLPRKWRQVVYSVGSTGMAPA